MKIVSKIIRCEAFELVLLQYTDWVFPLQTKFIKVYQFEDNWPNFRSRPPPLFRHPRKYLPNPLPVSLTHSKHHPPKPFFPPLFHPHPLSTFFFWLLDHVSQIQLVSSVGGVVLGSEIYTFSIKILHKYVCCNIFIHYNIIIYCLFIIAYGSYITYWILLYII